MKIVVMHMAKSRPKVRLMLGEARKFRAVPVRNKGQKTEMFLPRHTEDGLTPRIGCTTSLFIKDIKVKVLRGCWIRDLATFKL